MHRVVKSLSKFRNTSLLLAGLVVNAFLIAFLLLGIVTTSEQKQQTQFTAGGITQNLRVIEIRYYPDGVGKTLFDPAVLSQQLQTGLKDGSKFHGYKNASAVPALQVQVVKIYTREFANIPNVNNDWTSGYDEMLRQDNICDVIVNQKIDQVWLWVDPSTKRPGGGPGVEYAISSKYFQKGIQYATLPSHTFCNGQRGFVIMGFDTTRPYDNALHSFGHMMEGLLGNLQTTELFWFRFAGNTQNGWPLEKGCGNVHYAPNSLTDYDIASMKTVSSTCEDWNPNVNGAITNLNCTRWGCTEAGHMKWWFQNMPNMDNPLTYKGKKLPNWFDFIVDLDTKVKSYAQNPSYFMNSDYFISNSIPTATPVPTTPRPTVVPTTPAATPKPTTKPTTVPTKTATPVPTTPIITVTPTSTPPLIKVSPTITEVIAENTTTPVATDTPAVPTTTVPAVSNQPLNPLYLVVGVLTVLEIGFIGSLIFFLRKK